MASMDAATDRPIEAADDAHRRREQVRARRYPISRWYLRPAADRMAALLAPTAVRPVHLTLCGLAAAAGAVGLLVFYQAMLPAAGLILAAWFFDRTDGLLARRQSTDGRYGAWLDANVDELVDLALHVAIAVMLVRSDSSAASWAYPVLVAFCGGKHLFMYGLAMEDSIARNSSKESTESEESVEHRKRRSRLVGLIHAIYHLPANADVRVHLLVVLTAIGRADVALCFAAAYYNMRWIVRHLLVYRRWGTVR